MGRGASPSPTTESWRGTLASGPPTWRPGEDLLAALHETMGGSANLAALEAGGRAAMYAGSVENPVFGFRLGGLRCLSTGVYSIDRSLFRLVAPGARERRVVRPGQTARL